MVLELIILYYLHDTLVTCQGFIIKQIGTFFEDLFLVFGNLCYFHILGIDSFFFHSSHLNFFYYVILCYPLYFSPLCIFGVNIYRVEPLMNSRFTHGDSWSIMLTQQRLLSNQLEKLSQHLDFMQLRVNAPQNFNVLYGEEYSSGHYNLLCGKFIMEARLTPSQLTWKR